MSYALRHDPGRCAKDLAERRARAARRECEATLAEVEAQLAALDRERESQPTPDRLAVLNVLDEELKEVARRISGRLSKLIALDMATRSPSVADLVRGLPS